MAVVLHWDRLDGHYQQQQHLRCKFRNIHRSRAAMFLQVYLSRKHKHILRNVLMTCTRYVFFS